MLHISLFCLNYIYFIIPHVAYACPHLSINVKASDPTTWPPGLNLESNASFTLAIPFLLDMDLISTKLAMRIPKVHILQGGRLVFSPEVSKASLATNSIIIGR